MPRRCIIFRMRNWLPQSPSQTFMAPTRKCMRDARVMLEKSLHGKSRGLRAHNTIVLAKSASCLLQTIHHQTHTCLHVCITATVSCTKSSSSYCFLSIPSTGSVKTYIITLDMASSERRCCCTFPRIRAADRSGIGQCCRPNPSRFKVLVVSVSVVFLYCNENRLF